MLSRIPGLSHVAYEISWLIVTCAEHQSQSERLSEAWSGPAEAAASASPAVKHMLQPHQMQVWLKYAYRKHHPILQWLPTKLAEWIANNMQEELEFPARLTRLTSEGDGHLLSWIAFYKTT